MENVKKCFCGCDSFKVCMREKWFMLICTRCSCERTIKSPGVKVNTYATTVPFMKT